MNFLFILVALTLSISVYGEGLGEDWKAEFSNLKSEFKSEVKILSDRLDEEQSKVAILSDRLECKENEVKLLKGRVDMLETRSKDWDNELNSNSMEEEYDVTVRKITPNINNKTLEERVSNLEELSKIKTLRSCHEYAMYGITSSGNYSIDPDGELIGQEPFEVYCNFEDGTTELLHNKDFVVEIAPCPDPMCYQLDVEYNAPPEQVQALKDISDSCYQNIQFNCFLSGLSANDDAIGVWLNNQGEPEIYFTGSHHIMSELTLEVPL